MSKRLKISLLSILCLIVLLTTALLAFGNGKPNEVAAQKCEVTLAEDLKDTYVLGTVLTVPNGKLNYNEQSLDADTFKVTTPSGVAYAKREIALDEAGKYTVNYYKTVEETLIFGEKTFIVSDKAFSAGENTTIAYAEKGSVDKVKNEEGLLVSLANGEVFNCNIPIDLNGSTKRDNFLRLIPLPEKVRNSQVNELYVKLTDAYDSSNYVLIKSVLADMPVNEHVTADDVNQRSYQSAKANGQQFVGLAVIGMSNDYGIIIDGSRYDIEVGGSKGYKSDSSLSAYEGYGVNPFTFSFDYSSKTVFGSPQWNGEGTNIIVDLDDKRFFDNLWSGFTTGECYLSVYAGAYTGTTFDFMITDILGTDLTTDDITLTNKPKIEVEMQKDVYAVVGTPFTVFPAKAYDIYTGISDCDVSVFYNEKISVPVVDGKFTPKREGKYTLIYSAVDRNGNDTEEYVFITAYNASQINVAFGDKTANPKTGEIVTIKAPTVTGASGNYDVKITATLSSDSSVKYELVKKGDEFTFCPLYAGNYEISYQITDVTTTATKTETLSVTAGAFMLTAQPDLPEYFITGASYAIEKTKCYALSSGKPVEGETTVKYSFDGGTEVALSGDKLNVTAVNNVVISYYSGSTKVQSFEIPAVDVGYNTYEMSIYKYFNSKDNSFTIIPESDEIALNRATYLATKDGAQMQFIKKIAIKDFSFRYIAPDCKFNDLILTLRSGDEVLKIKLSVKNYKENTVTVNDSVEFPLSTTFTDGNEHYIEYDKSTNILAFRTAGKVTNCIIPTEVFAGFTSNDAYLEVEIGGMVAGNTSRLCIYSVNNQKMAYDKTDDSVAPEVSSSIITGTYSLNDKITLKDISVIDVLYVDTVSSLSMKNPSGEYVTDDAGVQLKSVSIDSEYTVTFTEYGVYSLRITVKDGFDDAEEKVIVYTFTVTDDVKPTITVETYNEGATVGEELVVREYSVTDNLDGAEDIRTGSFIIAPNGVSHNGDKPLKAEQKGIYEVIIYAIDKTGNMAQASYYIVVE